MGMIYLHKDIFLTDIVAMLLGFNVGVRLSFG